MDILKQTFYNLYINSPIVEFNIISSILIITTIICAFFIILAKNPIHSILFLILVFLNVTFLLILINVEFLGLIFLIVYVGAIAVLFLFIVMMLNLKIIELNETFIRYLPLAGLLSFILIIEIYFISFQYFINTLPVLTITESPQEILLKAYSNIEVLGFVIYTYYVLLFLIASLILLIAILGAIMLTLRHSFNSKKQATFTQVYKKVNDAMFLAK